MPHPKAKLVVMISGSGSNLQAIIDAVERGNLPAEIQCVVSNKRKAYGLQRARQHGINTLVVRRKKEEDRATYDEELGRLVAAFEPDWIILAGWMHVLGMQFLKYFPGRVVNLHPALPGQFPGTHAIERAMAAYQAGDLTQTGIMVHLVPDEGVDDGPVLATRPVPILPDDDLETLTERVHRAEHSLLVDVIRRLAAGEVTPPPPA
jgi:phosphoribosylglycinamide formyltransferase-1